MAAPALFSAGPLGVSLDNGPALCDMHENAPPPPQLVMLANVAAADGEGSVLEGGGAERETEKEMVELKTVGSSYTDSDEDSGSRWRRTRAHARTCTRTRTHVHTRPRPDPDGGPE